MMPALEEDLMESLKQDYQMVKAPPLITRRTLNALQSQQRRNPVLRHALAATLVCGLLAGAWLGTEMLQKTTPTARLVIPSLGSRLSLRIKKPAIDIQDISRFDAVPPLLPPSPESPKKTNARPRASINKLPTTSFQSHFV